MERKRLTCLIAAVCYFLQAVIGFVGYRLMTSSYGDMIDVAEEDGDPFFGLGLLMLAFVSAILIRYSIVCLIPMLLKLVQLRTNQKWPTYFSLLFDLAMIGLLFVSSFGAEGFWPILIVFALYLVSFIANIRFLRALSMDDFPSHTDETC